MTEYKRKQVTIRMDQEEKIQKLKKEKEFNLSLFLRQSLDKRFKEE